MSFPPGSTEPPEVCLDAKLRNFGVDNDIQELPRASRYIVDAKLRPNTHAESGPP